LLFRDASSGAISKACPDARFEEGHNTDEAIVALDNQVAFDLALLDLKILALQGLLRLHKRYPRLPQLPVPGLL